MDLLMEAVCNDNRENSIKYSLEVGKCVTRAEQLKIELQQCQDELEEERLLQFHDEKPTSRQKPKVDKKIHNSSFEKLQGEKLLNGKHKERKYTLEGTGLNKEGTDDKKSKRKSLGSDYKEKLPSYEGYCLSKKGVANKWKKRYYLIDGTSLKWFSDQEASLKNKKPKGFIDLSKAEIRSKLPADKDNHGVTESPTRFFLVNGTVQLVMEASDEKEKNTWIKAIKLAISNASLVESVVKK